MGIFRLTNKAKQDLKSIAAFTQKKWNREQRRIYLKQFDSAFHTLSDTPEIGISCDHIKKGYRKYSVSMHLVFYRILANSDIEIVRILHKRMDAIPILAGP